MKKEELIAKIKEGNLTKKEELDLVGSFVSKEKPRTPLQLEIDEINRLKRKHVEVRAVSTQLISKLKSEVEGRGIVPEAELNKFRKAFKAMVDSLEDTNGE